tara:strand:- start:986 stop:2620 length:1635 start_codon:yes stop_codon:yes gene_type:complete
MFKYATAFCKIKGVTALIVLLLSSCGQKGNPSGGSKDNTPPEVVKSVPDSCGLNFKGTKISWKFDEYVTLSNLNQELLISPPVKKQPTFKLIGKKLTLLFDTLLNPNTTYSIFLGNGVKDLNEGNPLENNLLTFSTGEILDSLSVHGEIYDAESMEDISEGMVHLYKDTGDSIPLKKIPSYFAKVEQGHFEFTNLAEGTYKLFYLNDNNNNLLYDLPNESIAFPNSLIIVSDNKDTSEIILRSFSGEEKKQFLLGSGCDFKGKFHFEFNLPVEDFSIELLNNSFKKEWKILEWNNNKDSLTVWSSLIQSLDSVTLLLEYDGLKDTLKYNISKRKEMNTQPIGVRQNFSKNGNYFKKPYLFSFSQPISSYDTSKILIIGAGDSTYAPIKSTGKELINFKLNWELKDNSTYKLMILPKAVQSIYNGYNKDTLNLNFSTDLNSSFGNLTIKYNFKDAKQDGILQIYFENDFQKEIHVKKQGKLSFEGFKPGNYKLKYISDVNGDKKWTPGNYWKKKQPEMIYWYNQNITLRANWDLDVEWVLSFEEN